MQIEESELAIFLEGDNFTIDNQVLLEVPRLIGQLGKLTGYAPQIARENFNPFGGAMKLRSDTIEFILQISSSGCR